MALTPAPLDFPLDDKACVCLWRPNNGRGGDGPEFCKQYHSPALPLSRSPALFSSSNPLLLGQSRRGLEVCVR